MTIDIKWMIENLATKDDVERIEKTLDGQRAATHELRNTLNVDIAKRLVEADQRFAATDKRVSDLEEFKKAQLEERREHSRRLEDRRRQRVTWAITLVAPLLVIMTWGWEGVLALLRAVHILGPK